MCAYFGEDKDKADPVSDVRRFAEAWKAAIVANAKAEETKRAAAKKVSSPASWAH